MAVAFEGLGAVALVHGAVAFGVGFGEQAMVTNAVIPKAGVFSH